MDTSNCVYASCDALQVDEIFWECWQLPHNPDPGPGNPLNSHSVTLVGHVGNPLYDSGIIDCYDLGYDRGNEDIENFTLQVSDLQQVCTLCEFFCRIHTDHTYKIRVNPNPNPGTYYVKSGHYRRF